MTVTRKPDIVCFNLLLGLPVWRKANPMIINRLILISLLVLLPVAVPAQDATPSAQGDIVQLTRSLDGLIPLLKEQHSRNDRAYELQKLEIAISYLNFRSRSIEAKEKELGGLRESRDRMEEMLVEIKREEDSEEFRSLQPKQPSFPDRSTLPAHWQQRIDKIKSEISTLEVEIMDLSSGLAEIENYVEKNLKLIP